MEDLQVIDKIIGDSVKNTSYVSAIISSLIFVVYTLIIKITDYYKSKNKSKPILEMAVAIKEISDNVSKQNSVLDKFIKDVEQKDSTKAKNVIELALVRFKSNIENSAKDIIIRNNIKNNKELVLSNVRQIVSTEYYKMISVLSNYDIADIPISTCLKDKWIDDTYKSVTDIMFNGQSKDKRIIQLSNKLQLDIDKYITFINNKLFWS